MEQEYKISVWNKTFNGILAIIIIFIASMFFFNLQKQKNLFFLIIPLCLLMLSILIIVNIIKKRLVINKKDILCINLFSTKQLNLSSIKGYRLSDKTIKIEPISENDSIISIKNYKTFENSENISEWITQNLKDLDAQDLEIEKQKFLKDTSFGISESEKLEKLEITKKIANSYNIIGGLLAFLSLLTTENFSYIIQFAIPIIGIILIYCFDLIKLISNPKKSIYSSILIGFILPCVYLLLRSFKFHILSHDNIWLPIGIIFSIMFSLLYFKGINKSIKSVNGQVIGMLIISFLYGFGSAMIINCVFDKSKETIYNAKVIDQHISRGKNTSYYLKLSTWGPQKKIKNETVSKKMYDQTNIGDTVNVKYKQGFLNTPWFVITSKDK